MTNYSLSQLEKESDERNLSPQGNFICWIVEAAATTGVEATFVVPSKTLAVVRCKALFADDEVSTGDFLCTDRADTCRCLIFHVLKALQWRWQVS